MDENAISFGNHIVETVKHIDHIQKEIVVTTATSCITCESSLITQANNTIPVCFSMCSGINFEAVVEPGGPKTSYFRIECVRDSRYVTLRLLKPEGRGREENQRDTCKEKFKCTNQTCILDLNCVSSIQCFSPINCEEC